MTNAAGPDDLLLSRTRPRIVWAITTAMITFTILHGFLAVLVLTDLVKGRSHGRAIFASSWHNLLILVLIAVAYAVLAYRFFRGRPGARMAALGLVALNLAGGGIAAAVLGYGVVLIGLLPQAAVAVALLSAEVRDWPPTLPHFPGDQRRVMGSVE